MRGKAAGRLGIVSFTATVLVLAAAPLLMAQEPLTVHQRLKKIHDDWIAHPTAPGPGEIRTASGPARPDFGVANSTTVAVQAYAFQPGISTDLLLDDGNGYRYFGAATADPYLAAAVQVPSGVVIDGIGLSYCSNNAGDLVLALIDNGAGSVIGSLTSAQGCFFQLTLDGSIDYLYRSNSGHALYFVLFWPSGTVDGSVRFGEAEVSYHRVVSDPPPAATFNDVPTNHPFYKYIEALAASGITGGCQASPPLYCPDNPVTRGQMAVFLAKSLGLYWVH